MSERLPMCLWERDALLKGHPDPVSVRCRVGDDDSLCCRPCIDAMNRAADEAADNRVIEQGY